MRKAFLGVFAVIFRTDRENHSAALQVFHIPLEVQKSLAYRVVSLQSSGRIQPGDAAAYRIAVTKLDQDSAEVLMEIIAAIPRDDAAARYFRAEVEDHWRYSQASTVASGSIEVQRMLLSRAMLAAS